MNVYSLKARVFPMMLFYFPILILAVLFSLQIDQHIHLLTSFGVVGALTYFNSQLGRKFGKNREAKLWEAWGGAPSIQLFRWRNSRIDPVTKSRYHFLLQKLCPVQPFPTKELEAADPDSADVAYSSWCRYLISQTRDTKQFSLLFSENVNYGFWRNLWALKTRSIILNLVLTIVVYLYFAIDANNFALNGHLAVFYWAEGVLIFLLLIWVFVITEESIKIPAFGYAERLLESVNQLNS
jgi:hypothetical protein